jgi:hypothetical protein
MAAIRLRGGGHLSTPDFYNKILPDFVDKVRRGLSADVVTADVLRQKPLWFAALRRALQNSGQHAPIRSRPPLQQPAIAVY